MLWHHARAVLRSHVLLRSPGSAHAARSMLVGMLALAAFGCSRVEMPPRQRALQRGPESYFRYDPVDERIVSSSIGSHEAYDPGVAVVGTNVCHVWLEFVPGAGDRVMLELPGTNGLEVLEAAAATDGVKRARPTLTVVAGQIWLTYEELQEGDWDIVAVPFAADKPAAAFRLTTASSNEVNHATAASHAEGALWIAAQQSRGGPFDIVVTQIRDDDASRARGSMQLRWSVVSASPRNDWDPDIAVGAGGAVCVVWDGFDGSAFGVSARWRIDGQWGAVLAVAQSDSFEARARVAADPGGGVWLAWEEGARNWGRRFVGAFRKWTNATDDYGPLHRFRKVRVGYLDPHGGFQQVEPSLPMPSFELARTQHGRRPNADKLGVYYERPVLVVDGYGRPWVVYRHYHQTQLAGHDPVVHHIESGWELHARYLQGSSWSPLYSLEPGQRDGAQRLSVAGLQDGLVATWSTGRTDRRKNEGSRGVRSAQLRRRGSRSETPAGVTRRLPASAPVPEPSLPPRTRIGAATYHLAMGDLHRHTDLSLCFPFFDGSLHDAYRYAMDVAELAFLGVTDHTRDIDRGNVQSQLWWRSLKEVERHHIPGHFHPFFAYERSNPDTDHNVISLRTDMLRDFRPPLSQFWSEIEDDQTITIPHTTPDRANSPFNGSIWDSQDDARRPLLEVYQGFRDTSLLEEAQVPLKKGYHLGLIASSDHMSTHASFAGVWTRSLDREAIFHALRAKRAYGATSPILLVFRAGDRWMGERLETDGPIHFSFEARGTGPISHVELWVDGEKSADLSFPPASDRVQGSHRVDSYGEGEHFAFVRVVQDDGHRAWSSPIWWRRPQVAR